MQKVDSKCCCCCYLFNRRKKTNRLFSDAREHIYDVMSDLSLTPVVRRGGRFYNYESITASGSLNPSQTTIAVWSNVLKEAVLR